MKQKETDTLDFMAQCHEVGLKMDRNPKKDQDLLINSRSDSLAPLTVLKSDLPVLHLEKKKQQQQQQTTNNNNRKQTNHFSSCSLKRSNFLSFPFHDLLSVVTFRNRSLCIHK